MQILVVDDEKLILEIFEEYLEMCGHVPVTAQNGRQALTYYLEQPDAFDLVLTDINMPILDGIELAYRIRAVRPFVPIVFISARLESDLWDDIRQLQPCKWLKKPFELDALNRIMDSISAETKFSCVPLR